MTDFVQSRRFGREAENLYVYSTLMRMVYQHDAALWQQLVDEVDLCTSFEDHPAAGPLIPGWCILRGKKGCILVIDGTTNSQQVVSEIFGAGQDSLEDFPGEVAINFFSFFQSLRGAIVPAIAAGEHSNITVLGHSLGGVIALYFGYELSVLYQNEFNGIITEAAPRGGNLAFAQAMTFPILRLENTGDPVPQLPPELNAVLHPTNVRNIYNINLEHFAHAGSYYLISPNGGILSGYGESEATGGYPAPPLPIQRAAIDLVDSFPHNSDEYARRLRIRLLRAPGLRRMLSPLRATLDRINTTLNSRQGINWGLDVPSGLPTVWLQEVRGPAPTTRPLVNAVDP